MEMTQVKSLDLCWKWHLFSIFLISCSTLS